MSVTEMKTEVISKITSLENETLLQKVLALLNESTSSKNSSSSLSHFYDDIKHQYGDVLQDLAK